MGNIDAQDTVSIEGIVFQGITVVPGLGQVLGSKGAAVHDHQTAIYQVGDIGYQRCRVHCHQHVEGITCGGDIFGTEIDLEGRDAKGGAYRRTNLSRKVREGGKVIAIQRSGLGKVAPRQLHAVT